MIIFKKLHEDAQLPTKGSKESAGLDLTALESGIIPPCGRAMFRTGLAMALPKGFVGLIWPRSKLAAKKGIDVLAGVIDSDYRGEIQVSLLNTSSQSVEIRKSDKCAQLIIQKHFSDLPLIEATEHDWQHLEDTSERGKAGINSTEMRLR